MDATSLRQFLNTIHTYKGLNKLEVFSENKMKNKPLRWWLQQMDDAMVSEEPFNVTKFITDYKILSQKKLRSAEYLNEVLDWAINNKSKFKAGLQNSKMVQFRQNITKNEQQEQEREKEATAVEETPEETKKAFRSIANFLKCSKLTEYQQHVKDEMSDASPEDLKDRASLMSEISKKWQEKRND